MDTSELTRSIKAKAAELGFAACGIARVERLPGDRLEEWLRLGHQGTMAYMARNTEKRLDPTRLLPGVRSIVSLALVYKVAETQPDASPPPTLPARISTYARGTDYHLILDRRLAELLAYIRWLAPETNGRCYADTGPLLEKEWAVRAGLGWRAKNTNILNRKLGSWFFLGEILLDVELDYDEPVADHCGSCSRCIDACPTGALTPYVLDSRRCVSYLTIELREDAPIERREATGDMIFGCDICQAVCPWNRRSAHSTDPELAPNPLVAENDLVKLAGVSPDQFSARYRGSAIKRAKWRGLMRNVAIALGNSRDPEAIAPLGELLETQDPMVRRHAAWALAQIGGAAASRRLAERKTREDDPATLRTLEELLHRLERPGMFAP